MGMVRAAAGVRLFLVRAQIVDEWERRVLADDTIPSAHRIARFQLRDYVPRFIDLATEALRGQGDGGELRRKAIDLARIHAVERIDEAFSVTEVLAELVHLRAVVLEELRGARQAETFVCEALSEARALIERTYGESRLVAGEDEPRRGPVGS